MSLSKKEYGLGLHFCYKDFSIYFFKVWLIIFSQLPLIIQTRCFMTRSKHKNRESTQDKSSMMKCHKWKETNKLNSLVIITLHLLQSIFSI